MIKSLCPMVGPADGEGSGPKQGSESFLGHVSKSCRGHGQERQVDVIHRWGWMDDGWVGG